MKLIIQGRFPSLNEYTDGNRANRFKGASIKKQAEKQVLQAILEAKLPKVQNYPVTLNITWYEANRRRDVDNIVYAVKFINDSLVHARIIEDDSQRFIKAINNKVEVDNKNPRIEVEIIEKGD